MSNQIGHVHNTVQFCLWVLAWILSHVWLLYVTDTGLARIRERALARSQQREGEGEEEEEGEEDDEEEGDASEEESLSQEDQVCV